MSENVFDKRLIERAFDRTVPRGHVEVTYGDGLRALIPIGPRGPRADLVILDEIADWRTVTEPSVPVSHGVTYYRVRACVRWLLAAAACALMLAALVACYVIGQSHVHR